MNCWKLQQFFRMNLFQIEKKWNIETAKKVDGKWHLIISSESEKEQENENVETDC